MTETGTQAPAAPLTRTVDGVELPVPGTYRLDGSHSSVAFAVRHLGLSRVHGQFRAFDGTVAIAERPEDSTVTVDVDLDSVDSGDPNRDERLRGSDFLDVANHPTMTFRTTAVRAATSGDGWTVEGDLAIRGVTRPVTLDVTFVGAGVDPWGGRRIAFTATGEIDRESWGMTWNQTLDTGGLFVGRKVRLALEVEAVDTTPTP